jgi:hypothetical protein
MSSSSQIFEEIEDGGHLAKIQKVKMSKTRLNKFINPGS